MKGIKKILLIPVRILSFFVSAISWVATKINEWLMDLCLFVLHQYQKVIPWLRKQEKIERFFLHQKEKPERLLLVALYALIVISIVNLVSPQPFFQASEGHVQDPIIIEENDEEVVETPSNNGEDEHSHEESEYQGTDVTQIDLSSYIVQNSDTVAWLQVDSTNINYPVVQTINNTYYLNHTFSRNVSQIGWIFADYRVSFPDLGRNTIIYGHNRLNGAMFGSIPKMRTQAWFQQSNHRIRLITTTKTYIFEVFSVYEIPEEVYYLQTKFTDDDAYLTFLNTLKRRSEFNFNVNLQATDKIITLSTCADGNVNRQVVHARLLAS